MRKWEYLVVDILSDTPWRENGQELPSWRGGPAVHEYMNQLGEQGWELAAAFPTTEFVELLGGFAESYRFLLKRPRPVSRLRSTEHDSQDLTETAA